MDKRDPNESVCTFIGGRNGMVLGVIAGVLLFSIISLILDTMNVGAGGPGLAVMAGIVTGGLAGTLIGALAARRGGRRGYDGSERRFDRSAYPGIERRSHASLLFG